MLYELGLIRRLPRIAVAQAERANPLYLAYSRGFDRFEPVFALPTLATAIRIGNPVSYERAVRTLQRFDGVVEQATEDELADAAARADLTGMFTDPHTGVALAVLEKLVRVRTIETGQRVVVLSTANGLKFTDFKVNYHEGALAGLGIRSQHANQPVELRADFDAVLERNRRVAGPRHLHPVAGANQIVPCMHGHIEGKHFFCAPTV